MGITRCEAMTKRTELPLEKKDILSDCVLMRGTFIYGENVIAIVTRALCEPSYATTVKSYKLFVFLMNWY